MIKSIVLDINKTDDAHAQTIILRQGDVSSTTLNITIREDGNTFNLETYEARFMAALPNGKVIIDPCEKIGENRLSYTLPTALSTQTGKVTLAYIAIHTGEVWVASTNCISFKVLKGVDITSSVAEDKLGEYEELKVRLDAILDAAKAEQTAQEIAFEKQLERQEAVFQEEELKRAVNEDARIEAEAARTSAESIRAAAEKRRDDAEVARVNAELVRQNAETIRNDRESIRAANEDARVAAEEMRTTSETARIAAEESRVTAENDRVTAELARQEAEEARAQDIANITSFIDDLGVITTTEIDELWQNN